MDCASVITYAGDRNLFEELEKSLVQTIPKEPTEWKRPYGRAIKSVHLNASFVPLSKDCIPKPGITKLLAQPILHTYWMECNDVETYKNSVKNDIEQWMKNIAAGDWMIVLVEVYDIRKSNKLLPRTTVLDKIRSDFAAKQADRVVSLIHPIKSESKSAESWRGLINRIRVLTLLAYNKTLSSFEEAIRANRECRPQPTWSYCSYFTMQEEMALVLEMLGLYEEALVQYDELDALFTQFVLNSTKGETPKWLASFTVPLQKWAGPVIDQRVTPGQRDLLRCSKLDLLQFRSYLLGRQCSLLLNLKKPQELAQRAAAFLHSTVQEMKILEVNAPDGAMATWGFLVCLEILQACEKFKDSEHVQAYSVHTAGLWAYARDMLKQLGTLCGLTSPGGPTSEQLHATVELASGMGDPPASSAGPSPVERLKEALSSKEAYNSYFSELSELAISTYKHIGRMRFARLIGMDLAEQYLALGQPDKAATFLSAVVQGAQDDMWTELAARTQLQLARCYSTTNPDIKYTMCCAALASKNPDEAVRLEYYQKFLQSTKLFAQETLVVMDMGELGLIKKIDVEKQHQIRRGECVVKAQVEYESCLPGPLLCDSISIAVERGKAPTSQKADDATQHMFRRLPMFELVEYKQDGSLNGANIVCHEPQKALRRTDSQGRGRKVSTPQRRDFTHCLKLSRVTLNPGLNVIDLKWTAQNVGKYLLSQLSISLPGIEFLEGLPGPPLELVVEEIKSGVEIKVQEEQLLAGIPQRVDLILNTGSYFILLGTPLEITCSTGLWIRTSNGQLVQKLDVNLPEIEAFETITKPLEVFAELPKESDGDAAFIHTIKISCGWCGGESTASLTFLSPLRSVMRLHSVTHRKFIQITMTGLAMQKLVLTRPVLSSKVIALKEQNSSRSQPIVINQSLKGSFLWELDTSTLAPGCEFVPLIFTVDYTPSPISTQNPEYYSYKCHFGISNFNTLFEIKCSLEAGKDAEFCRVGAICQLNLRVNSCEVQRDANAAVMYEVCADQAMWAICGRSAGVMSFEKEKEQSVVLELIPQIQGFLPLPQIRLSRYIPANDKESGKGDDNKPRLEPFSTGQVYSMSRSEQVHVLPAGSSD